ncbi:MULTISPECIES: 50S ribosomal protein L11 methyltransferase [Helicobacter]|uniref:50S ribosomal protein L11 methyltransferase n=1 Tax=Helicobacter typhlonius TaxID=76936 RepID=UPI00051D3EDB|nr:50S ribosomal protein L11 methyltransferase [Helicobacter sp. MIT 03-1616]TLD87111.1 50S ribosomal protein L11 methyltransferase [Helicobacter sp. MIT 03-1616]
MVDKQTYFEIIIHPNDFLEQFAEFVISTTSVAIEYLDISLVSNPFAITYEDCSWQSAGFSITEAKASKQNTQIITRLDYLDAEGIQAFLQTLREFSSMLAHNTQQDIGFCYHIEEKSNCDWIKAYEDSIEPVICGGFYIRPLWKESIIQDAKNINIDEILKDHIAHTTGVVDSHQNLREIIINPALAFGSGHHASTAMCLEFLSEMDLEGKTLLDVGCGSGILSIAACKLGAKVYACDTDEFATQECHKNATLNDVALQGLWQGSIAQAPLHTPKQYDVIVANIVAFIVKLLHNDFKAKCAKNGVLILSGILDEYKFDIIDSFSSFEVLEVRSKDGWIALKLTCNN